nr:hypothetical protein [Tanacetum cinerariifolium]
MGEPLSPDRVFDFPMDEPEPQHAYDFFAPRLLPGYAGNPNNTNGWIKEDVPFLGELGEPLGAEVDEPLVDLVINELPEPIVEVEEQMVAPVMDMMEDLSMLFRGEDESRDDEFEGPKDDEEVWEMDEEWLMEPVTPPLMSFMPPSSTYEVGSSSTIADERHSLTLSAPRVPVPPSVIRDLCTRMGNLEYGHGFLVKKVIMVSDAGVADSIAIEEIGPRVSTMDGHKQGQQATIQRDETGVGLSQHVQTLHAVVQHRDVQIQQLQTLFAEMSNREGTLMQCILGLDRRLTNVERRPPGPHLSDICVGSDSGHLEIIMIGSTGLGTEDCNCWGNLGHVVALE